MADCPTVLTEAPASHAELADVLKGFAQRGIRYLAVDGGDGTVRDVLTCGAPVFGHAWPELIILPKGKTNALTVDLGLPGDWTLPEALAAAERGARVVRRPLRIVPEAAGQETLLGYFFGAGVFTLGIDAGQDAHRLGAFNSMAVGVTIAWGIVQTLFGRGGNPWRAPSPMRLTRAADGTDLPHSRHGRPGERFIAVATTFEKFPLGVRPFGKDVAPGLKFGLIDWPLRWLVAMVPAILLGFFPGFVARNGAHRLATGPVRAELGCDFILDGESYPPGCYLIDEGPELRFVIP